MVFKVYIGGLPAGTTEAEVEREFTKFGTLATVWVARKPPGFAFVEYSDQRDADDAVRQLDGYNGWRVEHSRGGARRERPMGGGYGDRGGYGRDNSPPPRRRRSPSYDRARRRSPSYDRARRRSPSPYGLVDRRRRRSPSPPPRRSCRSPSPRRRRRSPSPVRRTSSRRRDRSESPAPRRSLSPVRSGSGRSE